MVSHPQPDVLMYCVDTSSLIAAWNERYPIRHFERFWDHIDTLVNEDRLISPVEVKYEVSKKEDGLYRWLQERPQIFVDLTEPVQLSVKRILRKFPHLTKQFPGRTSADPFVIALADERKATVVTEEGLGGTRKPRIPLVCKRFNIPCTNILGLIEQEDWHL